MRVYHDFFTYQTGVYRRSAFGTDQRSGFHSVRLIGWGEEHISNRITKYWVNMLSVKFINWLELIKQL